MLNYLKDLFSSEFNKSDDRETSNHKLEVAACALLIEIATADDNFSETEMNRVTEIMKNKFGLSEEEVHNIISLSKEELNNSVSIYEFTDILNKQLDSDEKYLVLKNLWHIAYADGNLDSYEDHYIKKISNNLHLYNKDRIAAKLEVKRELGL